MAGRLREPSTTSLPGAKIFQKSDERILGDGDFVESVLKLKISVPSVSKSAIRGEKLAKDRKYSLVG